MTIRRMLAVLVVCGLLTGAAALAFGQGGGDYDYGPPPAPALGGKAGTQLKTAIEHAKNAAGSNTINTAVTHLGHVLNCIEGTKGKNFNSAWGHVCQGQGDGIMADIKSAKNADDVMLVLDAADSLALAGVRSKDLGAVQTAARGVAALLLVVGDTAK